MKNGMLNPHVVADLVKNAPTKAEGCKRVVQFVRECVENKKLDASQVSIKQLGLAMGAIDPYNERTSFAQACYEARDMTYAREEAIFNESNPTVTSNAFQIATSELIASKIIEGYETDNGYIGDELVTVVSSPNVRNQRLVGMKSLGGPLEVKEGHPYEETGFEEKYVTTRETKNGRILSLTEELVLFDQTGEIMRRALGMGEYIRQHRERTIVRGVQDADSSTNPVWRPAGVGTAMYATAGTYMNYIGVGNTVQGAPYAAAVALSDWTDLDIVFKFRATQVKDDRVDGTPQVIGGLNGPRCKLLVPMSLWGTAEYITNQTRGEKSTNTAADITHFDGNPMKRFVGGVLASPLVDEVSTADWYYGDFKKQFVWTEIYPLQTFTVGRENDAMFERDIAMRVKSRYYGGISSTDTVYVTRVDGA